MKRAHIHIVAVAAGGVLWAGCVRRTVTVNTDPQGATVVMNDRNLGTSPVSVDFTWYGDYSVIVKKEGYETQTTHKRLPAPWYEIPPLDFISEALVPLYLHDLKEMSFTLAPAQPIDRAQLVEQAKDFRERALYEGDQSTSKPAK